MAFHITITEDRERSLCFFSARNQHIIENAIVDSLKNEPTKPTRAIKRLRSNPFAEFELRVEGFRVLYNVEEDEVVILLVGKKKGNKLFVEKEEFHGHESDPAKRSEKGPGSSSP